MAEGWQVHVPRPAPSALIVKGHGMESWASRPGMAKGAAALSPPFAGEKAISACWRSQVLEIVREGIRLPLAPESPLSCKFQGLASRALAQDEARIGRDPLLRSSRPFDPCR